jgi:hypothetical protein
LSVPAEECWQVILKEKTHFSFTSNKNSTSLLHPYGMVTKLSSE